MFGVAGVRGVPAGTRGAWASSRTDAIARARAAFGGAFQSEIDERRLFLWVPVLAGAGVVIYFNADREPSLAFSLALFATLAAIAFVTRAKPAVFRVAVACCAVIAGVACGALRTARVSAPVLDRIRIVKMTGFVEEMDYRREGARFVLRVTSAEGLDAAKTPYRVRLTTKRAPGCRAATISPATRFSRGSAPSATRWDASNRQHRRYPRTWDFASTPPSIAAATRWRGAWSA
jgi:hypothetical protein